MNPTQRKAGMISLIILAAFGAIGAIRSNRPQQRPPEDEAVLIRFRLDLYDNATGRRMKINDSLVRFTAEGITGYQYFVPGEHVLADGNGKTTRSLGETMTYRYFFYRDQRVKGLFYDSFRVEQPQRLTVDSMLRSKFSVAGSMFYNKTNRLIASVHLPNGGLFEKYVPAAKPDATYPDSIYLWYDPGMNDLRYSFNTTLDSQHHAKMHRALFIFKPAGKLPRREFEFRFERAARAAQDTLKLMKERFLKEEGQ